MQPFMLMLIVTVSAGFFITLCCYRGILYLLLFYQYTQVVNFIIIIAVIFYIQNMHDEFVSVHDFKNISIKYKIHGQY